MTNSTTDQTTDHPAADPATDPARRRAPRRSLRVATALLLAALMGAVGLTTPHADAAYRGYVECSGNYYDGSITVHPGVASAGVIANEYLYVASNGQWVWTGLRTWATSYGNGNWNTTWNVMSFHPLPYHRASYAIYEVLAYGGRVIGTGWYTSYDNGAFTSPRYTTSCYWAY